MEKIYELLDNVYAYPGIARHRWLLVLRPILILHLHLEKFFGICLIIKMNIILQKWSEYRVKNNTYVCDVHFGFLTKILIKFTG